MRLAYLGVTNVFALLRLLPMTSRDKDAEILALRHQLLVLQRQLDRTGCASPRLTGRSWRHCCTASPRQVLKRLHLAVRPDTVLRWHRDMLARRHAQRPRPGDRADRGPSARSAPWCCGWSACPASTMSTTATPRRALPA
jgi:hypothetical protein